MGGSEPNASEPSSIEERARADADDLQASLVDLAGLVADTQGLDELLHQVATFAAHAVPAADGAGVALLREGRSHDRSDDRVRAVAASHTFVSEVDEIQYARLAEGPGVTATREARTVRSGSLGGERMWPRFGPRVGRLGIHSVMSFPLVIPGHVVGAISVYAREKDAFDDHASEIGGLFAAPAAVAVHNAQVLAQARALTVQLQTALTSRPIIDQAIGLVRGRTGGTGDEAFASLRRISQSEHVKVAEIARRVVDDAVRRARAHHGDTPVGLINGIEES
jgi:GAF domain-containing protein